MKPGLITASLAATALTVSACATPSKRTFHQHGYAELQVPRSIAADYVKSGDLRKGDWRARARHSTGMEGVAREKILILNAAPYISEDSRALLTEARIMAAPAPNGLSIRTSLAEIADPVSGAFVGAGLVAEAFAEDWPDMRGCEGDPIGGLVCGLFISSVIVTVAAGAAVGAAVGTAEMVEENNRKSLAEDIRRDLGDTRPLAELIGKLETELASLPQDGPSVDTGHPGEADPAFVRSEAYSQWLVAGTPVIGADRLSPEATLSKAALSAVPPPGEEHEPVLAEGIDKFGLYPVREDGKLYYSLAIVSELTFARPVTQDFPAKGDEIVLTGGQHPGSVDYVIQHRKFPVIQPTYSLEHWRDKGSPLFASELEDALKRTAERMVDYTARLYRHSTGTEGGTAYRLVAVAPSNKVATFGDDLVWALNPLNASGTPPSDKRFNPSACVPARIETNTPSFSWQPVPATRNGDTLAVPEGSLRYDFRIFDDGLREVHRADALDTPDYILPDPLEAKTVYYWTVRARFELDGETRVTDWAMCGQHSDYPHVLDEAVNLYYPIQIR